MMVNEIQDHLMQTIIPFWKNLRDNEYGGYYGVMTLRYRRIMKRDVS